MSDVTGLPRGATSVGAATVRLFAWHAALGVIDGLRLLGHTRTERDTFRQDSADSIAFEFPGNWAIRRGGQIEIVACLHLDATVGPLTSSQLVRARSISELFEGWRALEGKVTCRLITNAAIDRRLQSELRDFKHQWVLGTQRERPESSGSLVERLASVLVGQSMRGGHPVAEASYAERISVDVARFMAALTIESGVPDRQHLDLVGCAQYLAPTLEHLGLDGSAAAAVWSALIAQAHEAMTRSRLLTASEILQTILLVAPATRSRINSIRTDPVERVVTYLVDYAADMSALPGVFAELAEEAIRAGVVAGLNASRLCRATAETLNGQGKTDILIHLDSGQVVIVELKYWDGKKAFSRALQQLLGYTAWRNTDIVIMPLINIQGVTAAIEEAAAEVTNLPNRTSPPPEFASDRMDFVLHALGDPHRRIVLRLVPVPLATSAERGLGRPVRRRAN